MKKNSNTILREYVSRLSNDDLRNLSQKLSQKLCGDYADVAQTLQRDKEVDYLLRTATSASDWFLMVDQITEVVAKEKKQREEDAK